MKTGGQSFPFLGYGLGLRPAHFTDFLNTKQPVDWLEIISENFMTDGGRPLHVLEAIKDKYRIVCHGVSLSIGSIDPLDFSYLKRLKTLLDFVDAPWFSDHICWTKIHGHQLHNLMPLPYTPETIHYVSEKIKIVQDVIQRPFIFENVSSYVEFQDSTMPEWDFVTAVCEQANCGVLLDINNIFVSGFNHQFDPMTYIQAIPEKRVAQFHLAGHSDKGAYLLDTHDHPICEGVWDLYTQASQLFPHASVLIERDDNIPALPELLDELNVARTRHAKNNHVTH